MEENKTFPEQKAPEKNTDDAFVQVGENGAPVIPQDEKKEKPEKSDDSPTTIGHR